MLLGGILSVPDTIRAVVFDVDGVLLDSLGADLALCRTAADEHLGGGDWITAVMVRRHFALHPEAFWQALIAEGGIEASADQRDAAIERYNALRGEAQFAVLGGIGEIVEDCLARGLACAIASSNDQDVVDRMLTVFPPVARFGAVSGIVPGVAGKPAPDLYARAVEALGVAPEDCAFIEDSVTGLQSGRAAGLGYAVAVATGGTEFAALADSGLADVIYDRFAPARLSLIDGKPTQKTLDTPNDFVSHMVEHIAWRLGVGIDLEWHNSDWRALGLALGEQVSALGLPLPSSATLGMIDDGAAEVLIDRDAPTGVDFQTHPSLPRQSVIDMRVEQLASGGELLALLEGLAAGLDAHIGVRLCTFEDPHHSWEGAFRATGICLARMRVAA